MVIFILKRLAFAVLTLVVATAIAFVLVQLSGSTPGGVALGQAATPEQVHAYNVALGWYDPWVVQYANWVGQVLTGNLGVSLIDGRDIAADIAKRLPVTAALAVFGTLLSLVVGVVMGIVAAVRGGAVDRVLAATSGILLSLPAFWVGVLLVFLFAVQLRLLPATGFVPLQTNPEAWARSLVLPVLTIAITSAAGIARQTRASMGEVLTQEHMRSLRALGTPTTRIIYVHALRGASLPILASIAVQFIVLFGGSVVIEVLFALPGIGQAMQSAVGSADLPFVQALVLVATVVVVIVNLALELMTRALDPKLRAS
ncbi:ABC transporter permease [uncultured Microbacterium sp.]|uniref:ABC-type dipeptide/oligopeptide/nickel transport system, permease component n=1 Tax=uncultured Microbacterium sp. TaxID=191216 RepID=A0A1Y5NXN0_9MICO|nr:ABC transporter permease [uncultured Microbacterium sp.]SBS71182.1 ABC-type dipeptide/oligopeptide/nickel transport system, permease component [uncultured Microbacterium sp.]